VLNAGETILLYKLTSGTGLKNSPVTTTSFFSKTTGDSVLELTTRNVERVFSDEPQFQLFITLYCKTAADLTYYDPVIQQYKINILFELSKK